MYYTSLYSFGTSFYGASTLITAAQLRAARALLDMDQRALAHAARLSVPTIQRMEGSEGVIRGTVDSLMKLIAAVQAAGVELINEGDTSPAGGRGVRLREAGVLTKPRAPARAPARRTRSSSVVSARRGRSS
jgi:transcriptional regulator with XRE-family HTH domain